MSLIFASATVPDKIIARNIKKNNISLSVWFKPQKAFNKIVIDIFDLDKDKQELKENFKPGDCFIKGTVYNFRIEANENALVWSRLIGFK